ncbi:uncharacterized protein LOC135465471 [Liolophura sinensis]|uniref:uncharacterized protein LOC135465471 n=1 Tax=Liolophura sinensis TaxID=3198878 RepID=UPI0031597413
MEASLEEPIYRKQLPVNCVDFTSREGKEIFTEALRSGHMECFFKLVSQFRTQDEPPFCGLSTLVMVLNALSVDPGRVWKFPWRWYHERMLACRCRCTSVDTAAVDGITLDQFVCIAENNFLMAKTRRATAELTAGEFRDVVKWVTRQEQTILVVTYSRESLNQTGDGHFSPIGGYHADKDLVLVLDTARYKYPPHWVPLPALVTSMKGIDQDTGKPRGFVLLSKGSTHQHRRRTSEKCTAVIASYVQKLVSFLCSEHSKWHLQIWLKVLFGI